MLIVNCTIELSTLNVNPTLFVVPCKNKSLGMINEDIFGSPLHLYMQRSGGELDERGGS